MSSRSKLGKSSPRVIEVKANFRLKTNDQRKLEALTQAVLPETLVLPGNQRCSIRVKDASDSNTDRRVASFSLEFRANDLVALRASLNTNLRLVSAAMQTLDLFRRDRTSRNAEKTRRPKMELANL